MHEYFGIEDKLSSIFEEKAQEKLKKDKTKSDKSKTRSSASSLSSRKNNKLNFKNKKWFFNSLHIIIAHALLTLKIPTKISLWAYAPSHGGFSYLQSQWISQISFPIS